MNGNFTKWVLSQMIVVVMLVAAGSAFAAPGDALLHNSSTLKSKYGKWGVTGGKYGKFSCTTCHNKAAANVKRVDTTLTSGFGFWSSSKAATVSVVFNNMTAFGTDAGTHTQSTAICQVCHSKTTVHRYNKPAGQTDSNHQGANQTDCTVCHSHASGFAPSCNTCHGSPPNSTVPAVFGSNGLVNDTANGRGPTGALVATQPGAHMVHDAVGMQCTTCHSKYNTLHGSTQLTDKNIAIGFRISKANWASFGNYSVLTVTYTGQTTANLTNGYTWLATEPRTTIVQAANTATCNVYCHGNWTGANGGSIPSWVGGSAEKACGACHGATAATSPTTAAHVRHAGNAAGGLNLACDKCHGPHTDNSHVTGSVKWAFDGLSTSLKGSPRYKGSLSGETGNLATALAYGQCSNLYCHSDVQGANGIGKPASYASVTWSGTLLNCGSCHKGAGGAYSLISSASHRAHVSRGYTYNCDACHTGAGDQAAVHADGLIQVSIPTGGTYSQAGQAAGNGYGTCSTTACHASIVPTWGTPLAANCLGCHGTEVSNAANLTPLHDKHMNFPLVGGGFKCKDCHAQVITNADNRTIADKSRHANSVKNYSGAMAGKTLACSNFYCHSNGKGTSANPSTWALATPIGCDGCHGLNNGTGAPLAGVANNSHPKHAPLATDCWKCHQKTASSTAGQLVAGTVDHLDRTLDARLSVPKAAFTSFSGIYNNAARTCTATYCHGGTNPTATPAWGVAGIACNSCHVSKPNGLSATHAFHILSTSTNYNYTQAPANNSTAAAYGYNCVSCHGNTAANHLNFPVANGSDATIQFLYSSAGKGAAATAAYTRTANVGTDARGFKFAAGGTNNCNTTYCHSNGQGGLGNTANNITWSSTQTANCDSCHGSATTSVTLSPLHYKHVNNAAFGGNFGCIDCHATTVSSNTVVNNKAKHVNKFVDYSGTMAGKTKNCANIYCHSNGKGTPVNPTTWATATAIGCDGCHGLNNGTGAPLAGVANNSHPKHAPTANDCWKCHQKTASKTAGQLVTGTVDHLDRTLDARLSVPKAGFTSYSGIYNNAARTCTATYCHGGTAPATPVWGSGTTNCNSCHNSKPTGLSATHAFHILSTAANYNFTQAAANTSVAGSYNYTCASCHGNTTTNHADGPVAIGSDATIQFLYSSAGKGANATAAYTRTANVGTDARGFKYAAGGANNCNTTYCHSNGQGGLGNTANNITWNSGTTAACASCHGNATTSLNLSPLHYKHVNNATAGGNFGCIDCHATTVSGNLAVSNKTKHVNKFVDYSGRYAGKTRNCSNIYCHSNGKGDYVNPATWAVATPLDCQGCHTNAALKLDHTAHMNKGATCKFCHNGTTTDDATIAGNHINGAVNIIPSTTLSFGIVTPKLVSFNAVGTTCNNISCHSPAATGPYSNTATWGNASSCETCHPKAGLSGHHSVHMGALNLTDSAVLYNMTANRTPVQNDTVKTYGFGCANCHPLNIGKHLDGFIDVDMSSKGVVGTSSIRFLNSTTVGKLPTYSAGTCANIYCHSNASRVAAELVYKPTPAWVAGTFTGDRCAACHDNQPATGAHAAHAVGNHTDNIYTGKNGKVPVINRANTAHGNPNNSTTIGCYLCHQGTVTSKANDKNTKCVVCHYSGNPYGAALKGNAAINNLKNHVNGSREIQFLPVKVISKAQIRNESFRFYSNAWVRTTYKTYSTLSYDTAKVALDTASMWHPGSPMLSSCTNIACHNLTNVFEKFSTANAKGIGPKPVFWNLANWNDPNKCMDCHSKL